MRGLTPKLVSHGEKDETDEKNFPTGMNKVSLFSPQFC